MSFHVPEHWRITAGHHLASSKGDGNNGFFVVPALGKIRPLPLRCIVSDGSDWHDSGLPGVPWEHVSVSTFQRCPTWEEMCFVKEIFWDPEDTVMQLHPPRSEWVNNMPYCLHLWRPVGLEIPRPPNITVGIADG
jgi:hypothetical protein